jgi:hypothetical protein
VFAWKQFAKCDCRVINVLKKWVELNFSEVISNKSLYSSFSVFVKEDLPKNGFEKWTNAILRPIEAISKAATDEDIAFGIFDKTEDEEPVGGSFLMKSPSGGMPGSLTDISIPQLCRQLTCFEWSYFSKITPMELRSGIWGKKGGLEYSPNVVALTNWFNKVRVLPMRCRQCLADMLLDCYRNHAGGYQVTS